MTTTQPQIIIGKLIEAYYVPDALKAFSLTNSFHLHKIL